MEAWYIWVDNRTDSKPEIMNGTCPQWICIGIRSQEVGGCLVLSTLRPGLHNANIGVLRNESYIISFISRVSVCWEGRTVSRVILLGR